MATNRFYQDQFAGQDGQTARAEQVNSELQGVQAGFDGVQQDLGAAISAPFTEALNQLPAAASRANLWLRFDVNGQPVVVNAPLNVRGMWAASTSYAVGDAFNASPNGTLYYVRTAYTSGATFGATDLADTSILVNLGGVFFSQYQIVTGPATVAAVAGGSYACDSTGGNITINLPTGNLGDSPVNVTNIGGSLTGSQLLTINSTGGQYLMGATQSSMTVDVVNASVSMFYTNSTYGWRLRTMG